MSAQLCTPEIGSPCRYQIRAKLFFFGCNFKIKDSTGRHRYTIRPQKWNLYTRLVLEDSSGKYVGRRQSFDCKYSVAIY